ncbi:MAG: alpha/beta hydrolase [Acidobacteria bacterium]|nr:alpha/beta hydrolase [Acidobacteriota bacterium]
MLHPHARRFLDTVKEAGTPPLYTQDPVSARNQVIATFLSGESEPEPVASIEDLRIPGPAGEIPVRIYNSDAAAPRPCLVYFHGGGWVVCNLDTHNGPCRAIARRAAATVVSVDYRLAPEHKFPAAVDDCYAATVWVADNADRLGIDPARISVGGDSAGGNLATVMAIRSRNEGGPKFASQILVYPVTDLSSFDTCSYREFAEEHQLTRALMDWFRVHYLQGSISEDGRHPYVSPLLEPDLSGLPPALVITAECDPLRDEGEAYARRLEAAGVPVTCTRYEGMIHPFFTLSAYMPRAFDAYQQVAEMVANAKAMVVSASTPPFAANSSTAR